MWVKLPSNKTALDGEDVTIVCKVDGAPTPTITWKFNGKFGMLFKAKLGFKKSVGNLLFNIFGTVSIFSAVENV